mmetsp:Transcript_58621/g.138056  ORF Transcript_58621/g.138056 Transcript_58621/m.138056 type:complete len:226 (+) Transcript_58621:3419-4096(+)
MSDPVRAEKSDRDQLEEEIAAFLGQERVQPQHVLLPLRREQGPEEELWPHGRGLPGRASQSKLGALEPLRHPAGPHVDVVGALLEEGDRLLDGLRVSRTHRVQPRQEHLLDAVDDRCHRRRSIAVAAAKGGNQLIRQLGELGSGVSVRNARVRCDVILHACHHGLGHSGSRSLVGADVKGQRCVERMQATVGARELLDERREGGQRTRAEDRSFIRRHRQHFRHL